jgi:hypothetical protein
MFIAVTLFLPRGIVGTIAGLRRDRRAQPPAAEAPAPNSPGLTVDAREDLPPAPSDQVAAE